MTCQWTRYVHVFIKVCTPHKFDIDNKAHSRLTTEEYIQVEWSNIIHK